MELRMRQASFSWLIFLRKRSRSRSFPRFPFTKTAESQGYNSVILVMHYYPLIQYSIAGKKANPSFGLKSWKYVALT